jgi:hypothetical protein
LKRLDNKGFVAEAIAPSVLNVSANGVVRTTARRGGVTRNGKKVGVLVNVVNGNLRGIHLHRCLQGEIPGVGSGQGEFSPV